MPLSSQAGWPDVIRRNPSSAAPQTQVVTLRAGNVRLRHQGLGPLHLSYPGDRPVVLFLFNAVREPGAETVCPRGTFKLLTPGEAFAIDVPGTPEMLAVAYDDLPLELDVSRLAGNANEGIDQGASAIARELRRTLLREGNAATGYLQSLAHSLLVRVLQVVSSGPRARSEARLTTHSLRRVAEHIDSRLGERIAVADLAELAGVSRAHFSRAFLAASGDTPHRFILARRLAWVRGQLDDGAENLAQLAARAGFSSHAHMSTAFRQAFGVSPREHRRAMAVLPLAGGPFKVAELTRS